MPAATIRRMNRLDTEHQRLFASDPDADGFFRKYGAFVIGPDGLAYLAYYTMERQADGTWRISGCYLVRAQDESV